MSPDLFPFKLLHFRQYLLNHVATIVGSVHGKSKSVPLHVVATGGRDLGQRHCRSSCCVGKKKISMCVRAIIGGNTCIVNLGDSTVKLPCSTANEDNPGPIALNLIWSTPHWREGFMRLHNASAAPAFVVCPFDQPDREHYN